MRKVKLIIVVVVVAASIWIGWSIIRARLLSKGFERIAIGDSRDQVMHLLGKPWRIERGVECLLETLGESRGVWRIISTRLRMLR